MAEQDFQQTGDPKPSAGQTEDYESRFKGMQTAYNKLKADHDRLQADFNAKAQVAVDATAQAMGLQEQLNAQNINFQGQLTSKDAEISTLSNSIETLNGSIAKFEAKQVAVENKQKLRVELAQHPEVLPFFESGFLNLNDDEGNPLEGEALTERVTSFKQTLGHKSEQDLEETLKGTVPKGSTPPASPLEGGDADQLQTWLMENPDHTDYEQVSERYTDLISA